MRPDVRAAGGAARWLLSPALAALLLSACTHVAVAPAPEEPPEPVPDEQPTTPERPTPAPAPPPDSGIAIVLSSDASDYADVGEAIVTLLDRPVRVYVLNEQPPERVRTEIQERDQRDIVAIGLPAVRAMAPFAARQRIYCQVFDDAGLTSQGWRGVEALPPFTLQLEHWTRFAPRLDTVGVIGSERMALLIERLRLAAEAFGIAIEQRTASSDIETLYLFRRLMPEIDGYVFLPDASVLSPEVIRDMVRYARKHEVDVLAYNRPIFDLGATLLVTSIEEDIAAQVIALLRAPGEPPAVRPLTRLSVTRRESRSPTAVATVTDRER